MKTMFAYIDELEPSFLQFWKNLCAIESPSKDKFGLLKAADYIEAFSHDLGFEIYRTPHEKSGDSVVIERSAEGAQATIALLAHMDTVHERGAFGPNPVREESGKLFGPGVMDCKGGIAVALLAMSALDKAEACRNNVRLILNPDEEDGSYAGQDAIDCIMDSARGCKAAINCEPSKDGYITVGRKGVLHAKLFVRGKSAHAGNNYFQGRSAIREAANKVLALEKLSKADGITYNCGCIEGGTVSNAVPENCVIDVDVRFHNAAEQAEAVDNLQKIAEYAFVEGTACELQVVHVRPAMECSESIMNLFKQVCAISTECGLDRSFDPIQKGGGSDSAYTVQAGVPTICSMGVEGRFEHTLQEEADIASLARQAKLVAALLIKL